MASIMVRGFWGIIAGLWGPWGFAHIRPCIPLLLAFYTQQLVFSSSCSHKLRPPDRAVRTLLLFRCAWTFNPNIFTSWNAARAQFILWSNAPVRCRPFPAVTSCCVASCSAGCEVRALSEPGTRTKNQGPRLADDVDFHTAAKATPSTATAAPSPSSHSAPKPLGKGEAWWRCLGGECFVWVRFRRLNFVYHHNLPVTALKKPRPLKAIDGRPTASGGIASRT